MPAILDACAIIAYLRDEDGADIIESVLVENECLVHALNLCEVYKDCLSRGEEPIEADQLMDELSQTGLLFREDMDSDLWKKAATIKASKRRVSQADCFALTLTDRLGGTLYTSDHHELDPIAAEGNFSIRFIR